MLYYLSNFMDVFSPLRIFRYITVRTFGGAATAFLICLIFGPLTIRGLKKLNARQPNRLDDVPDLTKEHGGKTKTPTMGGLLILASVLVSSLLWAQPLNSYVLLTLATMLIFGALGFCDDFLKVTRQDSKGVSGKTKLLVQAVWVGIVILALLYIPETQKTARQLMLPFYKHPVVYSMSLPVMFVFLYGVLAGSSNAVNLTDGLDGLAIGCTGTVAMAYLVMAYVAGHIGFSSYLNVPYVAGAGELAVFCGCLMGASLGFLWFNCHPARMFMGDTGSLAIGGGIAMCAILIKQELVLILVGGVFVMEVLSVVLQVLSYKTTGKRIFACAPIHHHFQIKAKKMAEREGREQEVLETMITIRFWIVSIIFALLGLASLKLR